MIVIPNMNCVVLICPPLSSNGASVYAANIASVGAGGSKFTPLKANPLAEGTVLPAPPGPPGPVEKA